MLVGSLPEIFILPLLCFSILDALVKFPPCAIEFIADFLDDPSLLFGLKIIFSSGAVELVLLGAEFVFEGCDVLVELIDSVVVGFAVSLEG